MKNETAPATVMLVDDTPANLRYLQKMLRDKGYRVVAFPKGRAALNAAIKNPPDIILLDILMPEMDGFEVCSRLKADPGLSKIPVLFISALGDGDDKARAFAAGGVDYVTKPFEEKEVLSRVETHLGLSRLTQGLENSVQERTAQLLESNQSLQEEIATRKEAEKQLRVQRAMLQSVFDGIAEPVMLVDRDMHMKLFNKPASEYYQGLGITLEQGKRPCPDHHRVDRQACSSCNLPECVSQGEYLTLERNGLGDPEAIEQLVLYPVEESGRKTGDVIIRITDITEERRLAQEMAQADKLIALGTVVAGVAHEINNPNHIILLNAAIVSDVWQGISPIIDKHCDCDEDFSISDLPYSEIKEEIPRLLTAIESSANRIKNIVDVLKNYSTKHEGVNLKPMDLTEAVKNTLLLVQHRIKKSTTRFSITYGENLPAVKADCNKLEQVFVNLISNALDALPDSTCGVFVETLFDRKTKRVVFVVRDEGRGIEERDIHRIMDPFFTTRRSVGGTGLGLAIAKQIVDHHGGRLEVESAAGQGSTFRVALPALV